jgi:hypothetical protein
MRGRVGNWAGAPLSFPAADRSRNWLIIAFENGRFQPKYICLFGWNWPFLQYMTGILVAHSGGGSRKGTHDFTRQIHG